MRLINRKTNEMAYFGDGIIDLRKLGCENVAEMIEAGWEDYEEQKGHYFIESRGQVVELKFGDDIGELKEELSKIGNHFDTREEAEKAVKKLKAWERLKNGGITFRNWTINQTGTIDCFATWGDNIPPSRKDPTLQEDLDLLFGGEE